MMSLYTVPEKVVHDGPDVMFGTILLGSITNVNITLNFI